MIIIAINEIYYPSNDDTSSRMHHHLGEWGKKERAQVKGQLKVKKLVKLDK